MVSNNLMQSLLHFIPNHGQQQSNAIPFAFHSKSWSATIYVLKLSHGVVPALHHREQAYHYTFSLNIITKLQDHESKSSDMKTIHHEHHREQA
jgi:hypothetical protein